MTYTKLEGAELQAQPDVAVWGVCVHHASGGEGEGEGGEEGGAGGGTQGRKWLVLCEVGDDRAGCFFVGKWTEWQRVRARRVSAESFDPDSDEQVKRMSAELCSVCVTAWGELFAGELTGSPEAAWKQAEHPPPSTKERRSKRRSRRKRRRSPQRGRSSGGKSACRERQGREVWGREVRGREVQGRAQMAVVVPEAVEAATAVTTAEAV